MNFSQRLGLFILILISITYVYFSFWGKNIKLPEHNNQTEEVDVYNPLEQISKNSNQQKEEKNYKKNVKIYILYKTGELHSVNRVCDTSTEKSCFEYAIKELLNAPTKWEKSHGFASEIPNGTKIISVRESDKSIMIDLSSEFEMGGGAESIYTRIKQIIKTANANTNLPVYLYINGKQANVIGGEGIMIKQPLSEKSFDE